MKVKAGSDSPTNSALAKGRTDKKARPSQLEETQRSGVDYLDAAIPLKNVRWIDNAKMEGIAYPRTKTFIDNAVRTGKKPSTPDMLRPLFAEAISWSDKNRLASARALQKHGDREGSFWPRIQGNRQAQQSQAIELVNKIISSSSTMWVFRRNPRLKQTVLEIANPSGRGVRYTVKGLTGFIECDKQYLEQLVNALTPRGKSEKD